MEETPELYVAKMVEVFSEVRRVLKKDGTLWLNLGDSYNGSGKGIGDLTPTLKQASNRGTRAGTQKATKIINLKPKDLIGIPWMVAFALRSSGWYLRQDIIWSKPNCMPESVTDRCTKSHEYVFMFSKSQRYHYDHEAIKTEAKKSSVERLCQDIEAQEGSSRVPGKTNGKMKAVGDKQRGHSRRHSGFNDRRDNMTTAEQMSFKANKRSVWTVSPQPFREAHFATFPQELITDMVKAGCPVDGTVLDPFMGAGTTALVSAKLNRNFVGIELNPAYIKIATKRINQELGMFNPMEK
jgi:DNA modification methylase